jgi:hypothetical protein
LQNYYQILGLRIEADISEIKAAFRQLAKVYHPDVNPAGKEQFTIILKAYEVLSNQQSKNSYDYKLRAQAETNQFNEAKKTAKDKKWRFDERELKRRQYYNEHIKQYEKKFSKVSTENVKKANYNEFKYILFATPLAVILFLGIMTLAAGKRSKKENQNLSSAAIDNKKISELQMGDVPYLSYFGKEQYNLENPKQLTIKNLSGKDIIVCLFEGDQFLRSLFIADQFSAQIAQLPDDNIVIKYSGGLYYMKDLKIDGVETKGNFMEAVNYYKSEIPIALNAGNELSLLEGLNEGFTKISAKEFFQKNYDKKN